MYTRDEEVWIKFFCAALQGMDVISIRLPMLLFVLPQLLQWALLDFRRDLEYETPGTISRICLLP
jgi:hypothetical protein